MRQPDLFRLPKKLWNAGRATGPRAPFKPVYVWAIRQQLKSSGWVCDLALFNCALDAKLRACDVVRLTVGDVRRGGGVRARSTVIQQKTGLPVPFEITEPTRDAIVACWRRGGDVRTTGCFPPAANRGVILRRANTPGSLMLG